MNNDSRSNTSRPNHSGARNANPPMNNAGKAVSEASVDLVPTLNTGTVSETSVNLVASLNIAFSGKSNFTILSHNLDRQCSPELARIKETVQEIPKVEFQTLSKIRQQLQTTSSKIGNYRRELVSNRTFFQNEPRYNQVKEVQQILDWVIQGENTFGYDGQQAISTHRKIIREKIHMIDREGRGIESKIHGIRILREHVEYWQGFWDAIEDRLVPDFSEAGGDLAVPIILVQWVAGLIVSGLMYHKSWDREKFLELLNTWEEMLTQEREVISETKAEMTMHFDDMAEAQTLWSSGVRLIWIMRIDVPKLNNAVVQYDEWLEGLNSTEQMLAQTIEPFDQTLTRIYPFYGKGISVERHANHFCDEIQEISRYLKKLSTAKAIICDSQQALFEEKVYRLARLVYGRLERIERLCEEWSKSIDPEELAAFLQEETFEFIEGTTGLAREIESIIKNETREDKRQQVLQQRNKEDRRFKSWDWTNRPLVTSIGALQVMEGLRAVLKVIHTLSSSIGTGTYMPSMEGNAGKVERSFVEFNHSNSLLGNFFEVLGQEIQRGSIEFPERREKATTETKTPRENLFKRQWEKWRKPKPETRSIGGL